MTDEKIDAMEAGPDFDRLIAELVFNCKLFKEHSAWRCDCPGPNSAKLRPHAHWATGYILPYSTDIAAAWQVVEKMGLFKLYDATITQYDDCWGIDNPTLDWRVEAETAPLAICRAALKCCKNVADKNGDTIEASPVVEPTAKSS